MRRVKAIEIFLLALVVVALVACGGGSGSGIDTNALVPETPLNVQPISVDAGPANTVNTIFTSVTICAPNDASNCQTIDHVLVDTGSSGLRIMSSVLFPALSLPQQTDIANRPVVECVKFVDGFSWGPVKLATVKIAGEQANSVPIQIIGDPQFPVVPANCSNSGPAENTVQSFGANGVLGISVFQQDCGPACAQNAAFEVYYACPASGCQAITVPLTQQVQNPVSLFAVNNNGVAISLPALPPSGAATATGSLVFGIGTQTNNGLGSAKVLTVNPNTGNFTTLYGDQVYSESFIDSGSNAIFFPDSDTPICRSGFFCPSSSKFLSVSNVGMNGVVDALTFSVANADALFASNPAYTAFSQLAAPSGNLNSFDFGAPFFFGRKVFTAIEGRNSPGGVGPYVAY